MVSVIISFEDVEIYDANEDVEIEETEEIEHLHPTAEPFINIVVI